MSNVIFFYTVNDLIMKFTLAIELPIESLLII